jgi:hypothetical protein
MNFFIAIFDPENHYLFVLIELDMHYSYLETVNLPTIYFLSPTDYYQKPFYEIFCFFVVSHLGNQINQEVIFIFGCFQTKPNSQLILSCIFIGLMDL